MSLPSSQAFSIPEETVRVAQAAFPKGNRYMKMVEIFGSVFQDELFADLFPRRGQPAAAPWRLAVITLLQFMENLTDRQTAEAVRARIDWKYALGLPLEDPGLDFSVFSEFRTRLVAGEAEARLLNHLLEFSQAQGWLKARTRQRTDATHVVAAVRELTRLEFVGETLLQALNALTRFAPGWLQQQVPASWFKRYAQPFSEYRLPKQEKERQALGLTIGQDGVALLQAVYGAPGSAELATLPEVEILRRIWVQQYYLEDAQVHWRTQKNLPPPGQSIASPYDLDTRYGYKRKLAWDGYKVHLTETCGAEGLHLITHVATTPASQPDGTMITPIHQALADKKLLPTQHLVDKGYMSSTALVTSKTQYGVELYGPMPADPSWQAREAAGYALTDFKVAWARQQAICPQGQISQTWQPHTNNRGQPITVVTFARAVCHACPARQQCTKSKKTGRRITLLPEAQARARDQARVRQKTPAFKTTYARRSGVEGTVSLAAKKMGLRRTRYRGLAKTHLQNLMTAAAINLSRILNWVEDAPRAKTYYSPFSRLAPA